MSSYGSQGSGSRSSMNIASNDHDATHMKYSEESSQLSQTEDERRLMALGYKQEVKRIFNQFTNFGLTSSMISVLLGVVPLYTFELESGGPAVQFWSWIIVGPFTVLLVCSLAGILTHLM